MIARRIALYLVVVFAYLLLSLLLFVSPVGMAITHIYNSFSLVDCELNESLKSKHWHQLCLNG